MARIDGSLPDPNFGVADSILATELGMAGALLLVFQFLFASFVMPQHLFRERPLWIAWRQSFLAMQLNPWLGPVLGLVGLLLLVIFSVSALGPLAQVLALPLPAYLGALMYVAWREVFEGGGEEPSPAAVRHKAVLS